MPDITITLPDGSTKSVPSATTVGEIANGISPRLAQAAYAGMVNGQVVDLTFPIREDARVRVLTSKDAEAWCLVHVPLAVSALRGLGRVAPFWIRLRYQIVAPEPVPSAEKEPLTLQGLIDTLSRRRKSAEQTDSLEAGPFRLPD